MAKDNKILHDAKGKVNEGKDTGPINSKPQSIGMTTIEPGYKPNNKVPSHFGGQ